MIQAGMDIGPITPYGECINVIKVDLKNTASITIVNALQIPHYAQCKKENIYVDSFSQVFFFFLRYGNVWSSGKALLQCGEAQKRLGEAEKKFIQSTNIHFLNPLKSFTEAEYRVIQVTHTYTFFPMITVVFLTSDPVTVFVFILFVCLFVCMCAYLFVIG